MIKCLEHYLQMAREGELQGVQIVAVTGDKSTWASFEGLINYHLVGRMTAVQHRIIAALEA